MKAGLIFDLDGVLVDTAKYHYLAWKQLAEELNIPFYEKDNERLKGVSRMRSLEIILEIGGREMEAEEKSKCCEKKNAIYLSYIKKITGDEILPGVKAFILDAKKKGYRTALGSASKNAGLILKQLDIIRLFDVIVDGNSVTKAKPDPEVFILGAELLGIEPHQCIVFEDSVAGIRAAHAGGMKAVGIGKADCLPEADICMERLTDIDDIIERLWKQAK